MILRFLPPKLPKIEVECAVSPRPNGKVYLDGVLWIITDIEWVIRGGEVIAEIDLIASRPTHERGWHHIDADPRD